MVAQYEGQTTDDDNTLANSDFEMRTKQNLHDKEESARVSKLGKLAGRIGVGSSGTGTVFSTIGLAKSEGKLLLSLLSGNIS
jgi:succinyl-CoA synthetase beta subunit